MIGFCFVSTNGILIGIFDRERISTKTNGRPASRVLINFVIQIYNSISRCEYIRYDKFN
jgi:hypothetical protein